MSDYYKLDSRKVTLREYWNIKPSWQVLIPWLAGRLGIQMGNTAFRRPQAVRELEVPEAEFPSQARLNLQPLLDACLQLGFHSPRYYTHETLRRDARTSFISMVHPSGEFTLRLMHTLGTAVSPPKQSRLIVLLSELRDGTYLCTTDQTPKFRNRPGIVTNRVIGGAPAQLFESHRQKIAQLPISNPPKPVHSIEELDQVWDRYEKQCFDFSVERGLYVPMSSEAVTGEQRIMVAAKAMAVVGTQEHEDVLVELSALQNKKSGWSGAIWILVVSVVLFALAGKRQWSWSYLLILLPVLFVHELGHFVAMRAFHYRNLRMFFIPFFGAAVSGRHYNVPGWKKAVVSLMGPVPGIILGAMIGSIGYVIHNALLVKIAVVSLFLNGSNLIPLLPLDGGWIFHALLFCRHYLLDTIFRVVAALGLFAFGIFTHSKILMYLGIPMLISIPVNFRLARIAAELRTRGLPPVSQDDQTIPPETAHAIITEVKKITPGKHSAKIVAQQTLQIFETLNARPPGWAATGGLLLAQLVSIGMAAVFGLGLMVAQRERSMEPYAALTREPKRSFTCGRVESWQGAQADSIAPRTTLIAHFSGESAAQTNFRLLTNQVPASATVRTFGDSVVLTLPGAEADVVKQWLAELKRKANFAFAGSSNMPIMLSLAAQFPTQEQAQNVKQELTEYFTVSHNESLIPPWYPGDSRTAEERAAHRLARKSYLKAESAADSEDDPDPRLRDLQKQLGQAIKKDDKLQVEALETRIESLSTELVHERISNLEKINDGSVDPVTVELYAESLASSGATNREAAEKTLPALSRRMGQLPNRKAGDAPDTRFSARSAMVSSEGRKLTLSWAVLNQIGDGFPALLEWLCANGGSDFKYDISPGPDWFKNVE